MVLDHRLHMDGYWREYLVSWMYVYRVVIFLYICISIYIYVKSTLFIMLFTENFLNARFWRCLNLNSTHYVFLWWFVTFRDDLFIFIEWFVSSPAGRDTEHIPKYCSDLNMICIWNTKTVKLKLESTHTYWIFVLRLILQMMYFAQHMSHKSCSLV